MEFNHIPSCNLRSQHPILFSFKLFFLISTFPHKLRPFSTFIGHRWYTSFCDIPVFPLLTGQISDAQRLYPSREATLVIDHFIITEEVLQEGDYCIYREATLVIDHFIIAEEVLQEGDYCIYFSPFYFIVLSSLKQGTVKPVHVVTSIKSNLSMWSPLLSSHLY
jgi:hypothetical protein